MNKKEEFKSLINLLKELNKNPQGKLIIRRAIFSGILTIFGLTLIGFYTNLFVLSGVIFILIAQQLTTKNKDFFQTVITDLKRQSDIELITGVIQETVNKVGIPKEEDKKPPTIN